MYQPAEPHLLQSILPLVNASKAMTQEQKDAIAALLQGGGLHGEELSQYLPASEAADRLHVATTTVLSWVRWGSVRAKRIGKRVLVVRWEDCLAEDGASRKRKQRRHYI